MSSAIELQLTADDLRRAYIVHYRDFGPKSITLMFLIPLGLAVILCFVDGWQGTEYALKLYIGLLAAQLAVSFMIRGFTHYWWLPRIASRSYTQQKDIRSPILWRWDDDHIVMGGLYSEATFPWKEFHQWMKTDDMLLIYRSEQMFYFLPINGDDARVAAESIAERLMHAGIKLRANRQ
jgi:hypothetical protein